MFNKIIMIMVVLFSLQGCYWNTGVSENQVGLAMSDGVSVDNVLPPGRHSDMSYWADVVVMDGAVKTWEWVDPDLATKDKQIFGLSLAVSVKRDITRAKEMYNQYRVEALDDAAFQAVVFNRVPRIVKQITTKYTLDELLGVDSESSREKIGTEIAAALSKEVEEVYGVLVDVGINNVAPSESYRVLLERKAAAAGEKEIAEQEAATLKEELEKQKAETLIQVEIASRQQAVDAAKAKTLEDSPQILQLELARIMADAIRDNDKIYFVPQGASLNMFLGQDIPIVSTGVITK